jgi:hypothetical protein
LDYSTGLKPKSKIEEIVGKPVTNFAYPFGLWNSAAIPELKQSGYKTWLYFVNKEIQ